MCSMLGPYFVDKINYLKKSEFELKIENEFLREKIYKQELAYNNNNNNNNQINSENVTTQEFVFKNSTTSNQNTKGFNNELFTRLNQKLSTDKETGFKQSNFKRISDPLSKIMELINKILFICDIPLSSTKDEKFSIIHKFKKKLFNTRGENWNGTSVNKEIMKVLLYII